MKTTTIEWTDHTFNPVWGCMKVSAGCKNCYAETFSNRFGHNLWGPNSSRRTFGAKHWAEPLAWQAAAAQAGERRRVFCASMADVFEDHPTMNEERPRLWELIRNTPDLDWQLLTKRPENIARMLPDDWGRGYANVWLGTSVENQDAADTRIPHLLRVPAVVRFLSCEPLLGPVNITDQPWWDWRYTYGFYPPFMFSRPIDWVIVGGESGRGARPMHPDWARGIRDQCIEAGVAFLFKQWGEFTPYYEAAEGGELVMREYTKGMKRVGKKAAGRMLDGRTWDEFPVVQVAR